MPDEPSIPSFSREAFKNAKWTALRRPGGLTVHTAMVEGKHIAIAQYSGEKFPVLLANLARRLFPEP